MAFKVVFALAAATALVAAEQDRLGSALEAFEKTLEATSLNATDGPEHKLCNPGQYRPTIADDCTDCPASYFQNEEGGDNAGERPDLRSSCTVCPEGFYQEEVGKTECVIPTKDDWVPEVGSCYKFLTTDTQNGNPGNSGQPAGWGLSAWHAHGAERNSHSAWVAVHSGDKWPMIWKIAEGRIDGTYQIQTTVTDSDHQIPAGWGLSSWNAHGAARNSHSSRVAVHEGSTWPTDWHFVEGQKDDTVRILTAGEQSNHHQPKDWGLTAWQKHASSGFPTYRNSGSSWVYTHDGDHWPMDWTMTKVDCP